MTVDVPVPPWRKAPRSAKTRQLPLSQDSIVDTAMRVLDAEGLDAVSMRRVATELDTGPASLYVHVQNKDELLELMVERSVEHLRMPEPDPARWQEQLKEVARAIHGSLCAHRDLARAAMVGIPAGPNALRVAEGLLAIMRAGGVPNQLAAWFLDRLFIYIDGDAFEGSQWLNRVPAGVSPEQYVTHYLEQMHAYFASLPPERFPTLTSMVDQLFTSGDDQRFEFGLDLLVRGLASYVTD